MRVKLLLIPIDWNQGLVRFQFENRFTCLLFLASRSLKMTRLPVLPKLKKFDHQGLIWVYPPLSEGAVSRGPSDLARRSLRKYNISVPWGVSTQNVVSVMLSERSQE